MQPILTRITVYPIKSLDGHRLQKVSITGGGSLAHDREFALVDDAGQYINGKRTSRVHHLRTSADLSSGVINFSAGGKCVRFDVGGETVETEEWLGSFFGHRISLRHDSLTGFPDDTNANGPTLVSTASIEEVASWFSGLNADEVRRRFRPNLEISGVPAFWEDRLFGGRSEVVRFTIGPVSFEGTNPCARCVVPTRNPETGSAFVSGFRARRLRDQVRLPIVELT